MQLFSATSPHPDVLKTIHLMIYRDSRTNDKIIEFLEAIKNKYSIKSRRFYKDNETYRQDAKPMIAFTNDSKIEIRTETMDTSYGSFYIVDFDLVK